MSQSMVDLSIQSCLGKIMSNHKPVKVVFGGTSGIGPAITLGFAEDGSIVVPMSRSIEKVNSTLQTLEKILLDAI